MENYKSYVSVYSSKCGISSHECFCYSVHNHPSKYSSVWIGWRSWKSKFSIISHDTLALPSTSLNMENYHKKCMCVCSSLSLSLCIYLLLKFIFNLLYVIERKKNVETIIIILIMVHNHNVFF
jgi:hypothetical protein